MATVTQEESATSQGDVRVLHGVPYQMYVRLTRHPDNAHLRMAYWDGTLEIMSPRLHQHDEPTRRLGIIIITVADALGLPYNGTRSFTVRRQGDGPLKGTGREADESFYIQNVARLPRDREPDLNLGDPPPDLWVEVDHRSSSRSRLPTYARLGIPEAWQYRAESKKIRFWKLAGTEYQRVDRSLALPVLTPALVRDALDQGRDMMESEWVKWLRVWARRFGDQPI